MKKLCIILVTLVTLSLPCFAEWQEVDDITPVIPEVIIPAVPQTRILRWTSDNIIFNSATTYTVLIMVNPRKQINSGTTYYSINSADETSTLIIYKGKDLSEYTTTQFNFEVKSLSK